MAKFADRLQHAWNAFTNPDTKYVAYGESVTYTRPDRPRFSRCNEKTVITAIYNRIALDVSSITFQHARVDDNGKYVEKIDSTLNQCLNVSANLDQTGRSFIQDICVSLFDEGCVAIVPVETSVSPKDKEGSYDILEMRTGKIVEWMPNRVKVKIYNEKTGNKEEIILPKKNVAIIENPFYSVMNERSSTLKRLIQKMNLLDQIDEQSGSGKLDMIIQLPYVVKTEARRQQAEKRRKDIEEQLAGSKYGIAYTDGTEKIVQLNRSLENNLEAQIKDLTSMLYDQLNITPEVMNGSANEDVMTNYLDRTVEPIASAIVDEMKRKFLTKTARSQKQSIVFFRDPFRLIPVSKMADLADKLSRNEILSSNEIRQIIGFKPIDDERANQLRNKNINAGEEDTFANAQTADETKPDEQEEIQNG